MGADAASTASHAFILFACFRCEVDLFGLFLCELARHAGRGIGRTRNLAGTAWFGQFFWSHIVSHPVVFGHMHDHIGLLLDLSKR